MPLGLRTHDFTKPRGQRGCSLASHNIELREHDSVARHDTANLRTKILAFRGFDSSIININIKGWNSEARREVPAKFESSNLSRDNLSTEIGRTPFSLAPSILPIPSSHLPRSPGAQLLLGGATCLTLLV